MKWRTDTNPPRQNVSLIAGPTASGKSSMALQIAKAKGGVIINTDSMQVYSVLRELTARPSTEEEAQVPHFLYGHVSPDQPYSTGQWLDDVAGVLEILGENKHVVFVGGTGLYFNALLGGLSPMPKIEEFIRQYWRARLAEDGPQMLHRELQVRDPDAASTLNPSDGQRIVRALEVLDASGQSILSWQKKKGAALVEVKKSDRHLLIPDRTLLKQRINHRFDQMVQLGAIEEVHALLALDIDAAMPAMRAIGVKQLSAYLDGELPLENAIETAKVATRQYAKRQMTWFRNQLADEWKIVDPLV